MYKEIEKLDFILENIENIFIIIQRHNGIVKALEDKIESRPAILMALLQIGETLNKLERKYEMLDDDIKGSYQVRNFIAHDYMGIDMGLIESIIRIKIPTLKSLLKTIINKDTETK